MNADLECVPLGSSVTSAGLSGRSLSANVRRLHGALNLVLSEPERQQFIHCLNVYHAKRNVYDLVQTLQVILNTAGKRQLLPMLRLVIPRSDQLLFDQYTSEGLYLSADVLRSNEGFGDDSSLQRYVGSVHASGCPDGFAVVQQVCAGLCGEMRTVRLTRSRSLEGLGFSIRGGSEHGVGIYVSLVEPGSSAEREGLRVGDQIVTANDMVFDSVTHVDAVKVLKGCKQLTMSVCSMGRIPGGFVTNQVYSWVDPQGRSVSPPPDSHENHQGPKMEERTVSLSMDDGRSLGLMIRGGAEYGLGIYITGVDPGSAADAGALKVGDQILEVNGQSYITISHDEAVNILKTGRQLLMKVRDVGRLPHARTVVDETRWICSQTIAETNATASSHSSPNATINPTINPTFNPVNNPCLNPGVTASMDSVTNPSFNVVNSPCINPGVTATINPSFNPVNNPCLNSGVSMTISPAPVIDPNMNSLINAGVFNSVANSLINTGVNACSSRPTSARATPVLGKPAGHKGVCPPGAQVSLEQQAYMLLTDHEQQTLTYYLQEYQGGHISVEPLAMALFELFNTHAKLSLLTEVRALVDPQDVDLFDQLVLHREKESHQNWFGLGASPVTNHCNHVMSVHDAGQAPTMNVSQKDQEEKSNSFRSVALDERQVSAESPPSVRAVAIQTQSRLSRDKEPNRKPSARLVQSGVNPLFSGPSRLLQDCLHKSLKSLPVAQHTCTGPTQHTFMGPTQHTCIGPTHHTSLNILHQTCQNSLSEPHPHFALHPLALSDRHHTCPGFLHHRDAKPEPSVKLCSRSSSYEKSAILSKSSSKAASPLHSPHLSPHPSPCASPCPTLITPDRPCSPALAQRVVITDMNRLSAESRTQQRGATLSQLSDSGQTLSEDSGVDIAEAGGLSKDGSPRPCKNQQIHMDQPRANAPPLPGAVRQLTASPIPASTATLVRVLKNANTLGIAIEGGANTRQPLPRIVTIQKGGSAHNCTQLRVGQVILEVNSISLKGREHKDAARIIAEAFKTKDKDHIDFLVVEPPGGGH